MIQVLFDICMPNSCAECPFLVHCDSCESWENKCMLLPGNIDNGYDYNEPYTPKDHRHENCPLKEVEERPHSEWLPMITKDDYGESVLGYKCKRCGWLKPHDKIPFCENCGSDMRKRE